MSKFEIDEEELYDAVINSTSFTEVVARLGKDTRFLPRVKEKIKELNLDVDHWPRKGIKRLPDNISLEIILVKNSWYTNTTQLKERLLKENILEKFLNKSAKNIAVMIDAKDFIGNYNDKDRIEKVYKWVNSIELAKKEGLCKNDKYNNWVFSQPHWNFPYEWYPLWEKVKKDKQFWLNLKP
jgi:hypothetical protein